MIRARRAQTAGVLAVGVRARNRKYTVNGVLQKHFQSVAAPEQRQFMKALKSGRFGQDQAHSLAMVIFG